MNANNAKLLTKAAADMSPEELDRAIKIAQVYNLQKEHQGTVEKLTETVSGHVAEGFDHIANGASYVGNKAREYPLIATVATVVVGVVVVKAAMDYLNQNYPNSMPVIS